MVFVDLIKQFSFGTLGEKGITQLTDGHPVVQFTLTRAVRLGLTISHPRHATPRHAAGPRRATP